MSIVKPTSLILTSIAIIFTIALTFASFEIPNILDNLLHEKAQFVNVQTGGGPLQEIKTELFISHFRLRTIGYTALLIVAVLIIIGFVTEKTGLTSLGAFALFIPVFGHFAATMFFLGGLGFLRLLWLPGLDISFEIMRLGDAVFIPYRIILDAFNFIGINLFKILPYFFIVLGLFIFCFSTIIWLNTYYKQRGIARIWLYKYSRHPQYLGWILWSYGILLMPGANMKQYYSLSNSLPWLISTLIIIGVAMIEEIKMSKRYGQEFENYRSASYFMLPFPKYFCKVFSSPFRFFFKKNYPTRKLEIFNVLLFYFLLTIFITFVLNSTATMEAPGRWIFYNEGTKTVDELANEFVKTPERKDKYELAELLVEKGNESSEYFIEYLSHPEYVIREFSADALGRLTPAKAIDPLIKALSDDHWRVVNSALNSLGNYKSDKAAKVLIEKLDSGNPKIISLAAGALVRMGTTAAVEAVIPLAENKMISPNVELIEALSLHQSKRAESLLIQYISDEDKNIRQAAVIAGMNYSSNEIKIALSKAIKDSDWEVRVYAEEVLMNIIQNRN